MGPCRATSPLVIKDSVYKFFSLVKPEPMFDQLLIKHRRKARRLSLSVLRDGSLKLVAPYGFPQTKIEKFVRDSEIWIEKRRAEISKHKHLPEGIGTKRHFATHKEEARRFI